MKALYLYIILLSTTGTVLAQENLVSGITGKTRHPKNTLKREKDDDSTGKIVFLIDWPSSKDNRIVQSLYSYVPTDTVINIEVVCHQLLGDDSSKLYHSVIENLQIEKGAAVNEVNIERCIRGTMDAVFFEIIKRFQLVPPGQYSTLLKITDESGHILSTDYIFREVDSNLRKGTTLRDDVNKHFLTQKQKAKVVVQGKTRDNALDNQKLTTANARLNKRMKGKSGVITEPEMSGGRSYSRLYYKGRFLGRYEVVEQESMLSRIKGEQSQMKYNPGNAVDNNLLSFTTTTSGIKDVFRKKEKKDNESGFVDISSNWANAQEPASEEENNFQELRGQLNTHILKMPVSIEGFYTTQDKNRTAKASYIRLHYDANKVKSNISEEVAAFKSKYQESKAKAGNFDFATQAFVNKLRSEQNSILNDLKDSYGIDGRQLQQQGGDIAALEGQNPELGDLSIDKTQKIQEKYKRLVKLQEDIDKYSGLIEQYNKGLFFDSALVYDKLKSIDNNSSSRSVAKAAEDLLPDGKVKRRLANLTSLDIGILNEYESRYTLGGQTLKGGKIGYDFNIVTVTATAGKTEYVSRDGNLDRYNSSMVRLDFKPALKQKFGVIYYLNSPTKEVFDSKYFTKDISVPTFKEPVHIFSIAHEGAIANGLSMQTEGASSYRRSQRSMNVTKDNTAISSSLNYDLPVVSSTLSVEWEYIGRLFENSSLPYLRAATERYTLSGKKDLFKSFLSVGVQYNFMKQSSFASTGYSKKWGFDIKTQSKRYPTVYLSYKPFSTFRNFSDTLAVQQRPMVGEVWIARGMYRLMRKHQSHNFLIVFNSNSSDLDTVSYKSSTVQAGYILSTNKNVINLNVGWAVLPMQNEVSSNTYFMQIGVNRNFSDRLAGNVGQEISIAEFGLQRTSTLAGLNYSLSKIPLTMRLQARYGKYRLDEHSDAKPLYSMQVGLNYYFRNT